MFKNIFIFLFIFFQIAFSRDYFVHLTDKGLSHRQKLLNEDFTFLSSTNSLQTQKANQAFFKEIIPKTTTNYSLENWILLELATENVSLI